MGAGQHTARDAPISLGWGRPGPFGGRVAARARVHRFGGGSHLSAVPARTYSSFHASVSVARRICSISSKVDWSEISGGASWTTGSPRSSARQ